MSTSAPSGPVLTRGTTQRVALWDNARFVLIALVVMGHAVSTIRTGSALGFATYAYIYLFHMPAMIALSGMFSKVDVTPRAARSTIQLISTWLIWEGFWAIANYLARGRPLPENWLIVPAWTLWFLVSLATMRILLPYIARLRHPLLVSVVLALAAGLTPLIGTPFSASRTLCFLPFFIAAWLAKDRGWLSGDWFLRPSHGLRAAAGAILLGVVAVFALLPQLRETWRIDTWLTWRDDYAWLFAHAPIGDWAPNSWWSVAFGGAGVRLALLAVAAVMTFAVLVLVPRGRSAITDWGARTLYVYLLHAPIIAFLRDSGAISWMGSFGTPGVLLALAVGLALAIVLSMTWVTRVFRFAIEPTLEFVYAKDRRGPPPGTA